MTILATIATQAAAWIAAVLQGCLAAFHLLLAAGAPFGRMAWGGTQPAHLSDGMRFLSSIAAFLLAFFAITVLARAGIVVGFFADRITAILTWGAVGLLGLKTVGSLASTSRAERRITGSVAAVACATALLVAVSGSGP